MLPGNLTRVARRTPGLPGGRVLLAMLSQALLSLSSFGLGLLVARIAPKEEYALYVIAFSIVGGAIGIQNALANTPLTVLLRDCSDREGRRLVSGVIVGQFLAFVPITCVGIAAFYAIAPFVGALEPLRSIVPFLAAALLGWLAREFMRTLNLAFLHVRSVLIMDSVYAFVAVACASVFLLDGTIEANGALTAMALGGACAAGIGYRLSEVRPRLLHGVVGPAFRETWPHARWALIGVLSGIVQTRAYIVIVSARLGFAELADVSAARLLMMPVGMLIASSVRIVIANGSSMMGSDSLNRLLRFILAVTALLVGGWALYCAALALSFDFVASLLGPKYLGVGRYVVPWALYFLFLALRTALVNGLLVLKRFGIVTRNDLISGTITLVLCVLLSRSLEATGALIGLIAGEVVLFLLAAIELYRSRFDTGAIGYEPCRPR